MAAREWGKSHWAVSVQWGCSFSRGRENGLAADSGDGAIAMWVGLVPLSRALKSS